MASPTNSETLGGTPEASEFGAALRDMRQAHNTDISTVASTLRIRQVYLQAIEEGRFDDLPGPTYAAGFVRAYAEFLGLDIAEVMRRYRDVTRDGAAQAPLVAPSPVSEGRMPTGFILLVAAVLAGVAYGSWYYLTVNGRDAGDLVAQLPQRIADLVGLDRSAGETPPLPVPSAPPKPSVVAPADLVPAPAMPVETTTSAAELAAPEPAPEMTDTAAPAITVTAPRDLESASGPAPEPAAPESDAAAQAPDAIVTIPLPTQSDTGSTAEVSSSMVETAPSAGGDGSDIAAGIATPPSPEADLPAMAAPEPSTPAAPEQVAAIPPTAPVNQSSEVTSRVILRATAISWVELRDAEGKRVFSRLLKKGETYNVPSNAGITLATGNAGALDILVDGRPVGPIGPLGAVRRDVLLEPEALLRRVAPGQ